MIAEDEATKRRSQIIDNLARMVDDDENNGDDVLVEGRYNLVNEDDLTPE